MSKYFIAGCYFLGSWIIWGNFGLGVALLSFVAGYILHWLFK